MMKHVSQGENTISMDKEKNDLFKYIIIPYKNHNFKKSNSSTEIMIITRIH